MTALITTSISGLKRANDVSAEEQLQEIKKLKTTETPQFKKRSNEDQFKSTKSVLDAIEDAEFHLEKADTVKTKQALQRGKSLIKERQKLILLADKSPYGWKTVVEYKQHDLADDEEDEKKIYRAEARAARTTKKFNPSSRNFNTKQPLTNNQPQFPSPIPTITRPRVNPYKSSGVCFACGKPGHWRAACPLVASQNVQPK